MQVDLVREVKLESHLMRQCKLAPRESNKATEKALEFNFGPMDHFMKVCGSREKPRGLVDSYFIPVMSTVESGNAIKLKEKGSICTKMGLGIREAGCKTNLKGWEGSRGQMEVTLKASTNRVTKVDLAVSSGKMEPGTKDTG